MRSFITTVFLPVLMAMALVACSKKPKGNFDAGVAAFERSDYAAALKEFKPLAEDGHIESQGKLCQMYMEGKGVPINTPEVLKWCRMAADNGHPKAQFILGSMYARGGLVAENHARAGALFLKAADQGDLESLNGLASVLSYGTNLKQDVVAGYALYTVSAKRNPSEINYALSARTRLAQDMTPEQISQGEALAEKWAAPGTVFAKELAKR
jgi:TPR repeat protein